MSDDKKFNDFIKANTEFKSQASKAELENLKEFIKRKESAFNPFLPFLAAASSLVLVFTFVLVLKNTQTQSAPQLEENIAEAYLFESYFAIEEDLESFDTDEGFAI